VGYKHAKPELVTAAVEAAVAEGISQLTFGRLAKRMGISDRMIVYYFPSKDDLIAEVLFALGGELQLLLDKAFGGERLSPEELARRAWPVLTTRNADRIFRVFFEVAGQAAAGIEPYKKFAPMLIDAWVEWALPFMEGATKEVRRKRALGLVAQLDGLLLMRQVSGAAAANTAAAQLGIA
jgi:AcrR family transcriptional regulator